MASNPNILRNLGESSQVSVLFHNSILSLILLNYDGCSHLNNQQQYQHQFVLTFFSNLM